MKSFFISIFFILCFNIVAYAQCPNVSNILNHGYGNSNFGEGNNDEFGITDPNPFMVKVDYDPPRRAFPKTDQCSYYYMSYDTDGYYTPPTPIPYDVAALKWHIVKAFRNDGAGHSFKIYPPKSTSVNASGDFISKFNGTFHDRSIWINPPYPWNSWTNFVVYLEPIVVPFTVSIIGPNEIPLNQTRTYIANVEGGLGNYRFHWAYRIKTASGYGDPIALPYREAEIWSKDGQQYYIYDDEHKLDFTMTNAQIEIMVWVENVLDNSNTIYATKTVKSSLTNNDTDRPTLKIVNSICYPNPFNPTTMIKYQITTDSKVQVKVFDVLGKEVAELVNEEKSMGYHEVEFDGSNLTSGVYFYRIQAGEFVDTKKMILMK